MVHQTCNTLKGKWRNPEIRDGKRENGVGLVLGDFTETHQTFCQVYIFS